MRTDSRLSRMLHVLLHMARHDQPFTSEQISKMLDTNPALVRRTMAGLKKAGYVHSENGRGGGWKISCELKTTTLDDIYKAVGEPRLLSIGVGSDNTQCAVEKSVINSLGQTFQDAERVIRSRLACITLADLLEDFDLLCQEGEWGKDGPPSSD
ncbi:Rrf2 family transcriptional regulator [Psychrobacter aquaticus]|uniref:Rrf2 family transcriptional regulator n=1 Tax=Psychrobacter aquaticus TaxID=248452 RepID=UPI0006847030|nr:Rrf2 family transcriptional regulator [Psychrobacter aquaticus]